MKNKIDLSKYVNKLGKGNQLFRFIWIIVWFVFAKPIPRRFFNSWKIFLLKLFGSKIHSKAIVYSSAKIFMPWNLEMEEYSCLASEVDCYNVDKIIIGAHSTVSQKSYLCSASHDISNSKNPFSNCTNYY